MIAAAAAAAARGSSCSPRCSRPASRMDDRAHRRAGRRPERAVPRRPGRARTACGCAGRARAGRRRRRCPYNRSCSPRPTATAPLRQDPPVQLRPRARALRGRRRAVTVDVEGVRVQPLRLLRPALRRRVLGARRTTPTATCVVANWPAARRDHWRRCCGAGDREPGVRRRREPGRRGRRARVLGRLHDHRPARRGAGRRAGDRGPAGGGGRPGRRRRDPARTRSSATAAESGRPDRV